MKLKYDRRFVLCAIVTACAGLSFSSQSWAQSPRRLPSIEAFDLTGEARRFPSGLPTAMTLLVVAFERGQQPVADRMFKLGEEAGAARRGVAMIETPVIEDPGSAGRFFIDNGMKSGIRDVQKRKVVVTLYVKDLGEWLAETGLGPKDSVYLMAVNRSGRILRSARADAIADTAAMKQFIAKAKGSRGRS